MSAAEVFTKLRVVRATTPASRKFHGTMRSAKRSRFVCTSAFMLWDSSTSETMERSFVSPVAALTRTKISPSSHAVPAKTSSPTVRSTASGSPVRVDWFTMATPRSTTPSTLTGIPVRTAIRSPAFKLAVGTVISSSPQTSCTFSGAPSKE